MKWDEEKLLTMRVIDTNLPFEHADLQFQLESGDGATTVTLFPEYQFKYGLLGSILDAPFGRRAYEKGIRWMPAGLKEHAEDHPRTTT